MSEEQEFYRTPMRWFAVYVRSRHEARVAKHFKDREIEFFLPLYKEERRWSDRKVEIEFPLFPGYLFVRMRRTLETLWRVVEVPGVITIVGRGQSPEALEDTEIEQLKTAMSKGKDPRPHAFIKAGERVMITDGPLAGSSGIWLREKNKNRVVLQLDAIQRSMSVEVDAGAIVLIHEGNTTPIKDGYAAYTVLHPELRDMHAQFLDSNAGTRGDSE
jgi:transcription termination/antitermination protein NusG